jgi:hypothetical protein
MSMVDKFASHVHTRARASARAGTGTGARRCGQDGEQGYCYED